MEDSVSHRLEFVALDDLLAARHPRNPKDHDLDGIEASFERFGFTVPVLLDDRSGLVAAGHGRIEALERRLDSTVPPPRLIQVAHQDGQGAVWMVPTIRGWESEDDAQLLAYVLADNQLSVKGGWSPDPLADVLRELSALDDGLIGTGYDAAEVDRVIAEADLLAGRVSFDDGSEWDAAMPEYVNRSMESQWRTSIHFKTKEDRDEFFEQLGRPVKARWWWPEDDGHVGADWSDQYVAVPGDEEAEPEAEVPA